MRVHILLLVVAPLTAIPLLAHGQGRADTLTPRQQAIFRSVAAVDGQLTRELYNEFWGATGPELSDRRIRQALSRSLESELLVAQLFQQAVWQSALESYNARRVVRLSAVDQYEREVRGSPLIERSGASAQSEVEDSFRNTRRVLEAAAAHGSIQTPTGSQVVDRKLIEQVLLGIDGSVNRVRRLAAPEWQSDEVADSQPQSASPTDSWDEVMRQIAALEPQERRSLVLCVRAAVTVNFDKTVKHNLSKRGSDALWAIKIYSRASAKLSHLADTAELPDIEKYFRQEATDSAALVRGEIDEIEYQRRASANESVIARILAPEHARMREHEATMRTYQELCERAATLVIADAKIFASEH